MTTYASHRREMDRKGRRIRRTEWTAWATHQEATGTKGKVKIDPADGTLWEWISTTKQLTWVRPFPKECGSCGGGGYVPDEPEKMRRDGSYPGRPCRDCNGEGYIGGEC